MEEKSLEKKLHDMQKPEVEMPATQNEIKNNLLNVRKSALLGPIFIVLFSVLMSGLTPLIIFNVPSVLWTFGISLFLVAATYGWKGIKILISACFNTNVTGAERREYINIFRDYKTYLIISGWTGFILGVILMAGSYNRMEDLLETLFLGTSVALLTVFYGYLAAYLYCYPILRRLENNPE